VSFTTPNIAGFTFNAYIGTTTSPYNLGLSTSGPTSGPMTGQAVQLPANTAVTLTGIGITQVPPAAPATGVTVQFVPNDKNSPLTGGSTDETGKYILGRSMGNKGCAAGTYSVRLFDQDPGASKFTIHEEMSMKSTLTFDVKPGANTFDIEIPFSKAPAKKK
jgi:hypothetical protein